MGKRLLFFLPGFLFAGIILIISSCSSRYRNALFNSPTDARRDTLKTVEAIRGTRPESEIYHIKAGDILAIRNLQDLSYISINDDHRLPAQSTVFKVDDDGGLRLPAIHKLMVGGLTRTEAAEKIQEAYQQTLLKEPIIELSIVNLKVTLLGEFNKQGAFLLENDHTSLIDMIGQAGGLSPRADPKTLKIIRGDKINPEIIYVNLKDVRSLGNSALRLQNNDIIYIEPSGLYNTSDRVQSFSTILQPLLLVANFALLIYNFTR